MTKHYKNGCPGYPREGMRRRPYTQNSQHLKRCIRTQLKLQSLTAAFFVCYLGLTVTFELPKPPC